MKFSKKINFINIFQLFILIVCFASLFLPYLVKLNQRTNNPSFIESESGFQYMIDADFRGAFGAIWTANGNYSFVKTDNSQTDITINIKFGSWNYVADNGISERMPWYRNSPKGIITTDNGGGNWWGTLITKNTSYNPAPWISNAGGGQNNTNPGIIWYWVR